MRQFVCDDEEFGRGDEIFGDGEDLRRNGEARMRDRIVLAEEVDQRRLAMAAPGLEHLSNELDHLLEALGRTGGRRAVAGEGRRPGHRSAHGVEEVHHAAGDDYGIAAVLEAHRFGVGVGPADFADCDEALVDLRPEIGRQKGVKHAGQRLHPVGAPRI